MGTQQLTEALFFKLKKRILLLLGGAVFCSAIMIFYALTIPKTYTSNATIFPLTAGNDKSSNSVLDALTGSSDIGKSFTNENSVNIVELAQSRTTREMVARTQLPEKENKTIAQILLEEYNENRSLLEKEIKINPDDPYLINWATKLLGANLDASITRTSSFQMKYTGRSIESVRLISYAFIDKISEFYIELKREKAKRDFEFATLKVDSLRGVINTKDQKLISFDKKTLFTNTNKLEYKVPAENVLADKQMLRAQYANAVANQQNAAYKLQKATPVIKVLDSPEPPFSGTKKSPLMFGFMGFVVGFLALAVLFSLPVLLKYIRHELYVMIHGAPKNI